MDSMSGVDDGEIAFDSREGFLFGIGGGAGLRRTCGPVLVLCVREEICPG